jgi:hypothetical protein
LLKKEARSRLPGSKFLHVNTHKLAQLPEWKFKDAGASYF